MTQRQVVSPPTDDLYKVCQQLGFNFEVESFDDDGMDGYVCRMIFSGDCYTTLEQAVEDLETKFMGMLHKLIEKNRGGAS